MEVSQETEDVQVTTQYAPQVHQQCEVSVRAFKQDLHRLNRKHYVRVFRSVGTRENKPRPGKLKTSKIEKKPSQLQRHFKIRASGEQISPQQIPENKKIPSDEREGDDQIPSQEFPDKCNTPSEKLSTLDSYA